jgi:membrane-bound ClpP family serine protease
MIRTTTGLALLLVFLAHGSLGAADKTNDKPNKVVDGLIVQIPTTISSESIGRMRSLLHGPLKRFAEGAARQGGRFVVLCDFNPDDRRSESDDFGACYDLATFLRSLQTDHKGVRVVAYIHGDVRRHSVLAALACSEIAMSEKGRFGQVASTSKPLGVVELAAYDTITKGRYPAVLIRKMHDASVEVVRDGNDFTDAKTKPKGIPVNGLGAGDVALFTFAKAKDVGLAQQVAVNTLDEVRRLYDLPVGSAKRSLDRASAWRIVLEGQVTGELVEQTKRRVERALRAKATTLLLEIRTIGGSHDQAHRLGLFLASLQERKTEEPIETIAYVTSKARNLAVFIAFGCNRIVMQLEESEDQLGGDLNPDDEDESLPGEARLGGFASYLRRHPTLEGLRKDRQEPNDANFAQRIDKETLELEQRLTSQLQEIASKQTYSPVIAAGFFDRAMKIHLAERAKGTSGRMILADDLFQKDQQGQKEWRSVEMIKPWHNNAKFEGRYLTLTARQAREIGLVQTTVKNIDELYQLEGLTKPQIRTADADWLDGLADFLRDPWTSVLLVMIGITCLILELKMPGVGLPGVVAAICFVLFFWSHSQLHGQITWLAILLFVLGLLLIGLEVFVLPGFGVCGISGVLLVLASLGLVAYGHWPRTNSEWIDLGNKIAPFGISMLGSLVAVALVIRYLPNIPVLNRLVSKTEDEDHAFAEPEHPSHAQYQSLLGAIGVAATPLRPAGKTQFGEEFVDVIAEGGYIMPGTRVQVVEVEGNRVVVKEV